MLGYGPPVRFQQRVCESPTCGLRFPVGEGSELGSRCPVCGAPTTFVDAPYATHEIRERRAAVGPSLEVLLDNVRSLTNVGSMFRTADAVALAHMHLGGFTPTPKHPKLAKTSLGAEGSVAWTHHADPLLAARALLESGRRLWALEGGPRSEDLYDVLEHAGGPEARPLVLVCGHEVSGVDPRILELCERVIRIPMAGIKGSLNVSVAFGVAVYALRHAARG